MKNKIITAPKAADIIKDGSTVMIGGLMSRGTPEILMDAIVKKGINSFILGRSTLSGLRI